MSYIVKSVSSNRYKVKVVNKNGALLTAPASVPTVATSFFNQQTYSTTAQMLANDATTYANAIAYFGNNAVTNAELQAYLSNYSNTQLMLANDATTYANAVAFVVNNYVNASSMRVSSLVDVDATSLSNNSTLVYSTANNKYIVRQMDLDGGTF